MLLLKLADKHSGLSKAGSDILPDKQVQHKIIHLHRGLIFQRPYALCCGYKDICNHNDLRKDFLLQTAVGQLDKDLGSSSTFSRLKSDL